MKQELRLSKPTQINLCMMLANESKQRFVHLLNLTMNLVDYTSDPFLLQG